MTDQLISELGRIFGKPPRVLFKKTAKIHIAIMGEPFLSAVFAGQKTVESRFSLRRTTPYQQVQPGDVVFMKAGPVVGYYEAAWVKDFVLNPLVLGEIRTKYGQTIGGDDAFWESKKDKHYGTLIGIKNVTHLPPFAISKSDRRAWVTLSF